MQRQPEDALFNGQPLWMSYLDRVDAVLKEALEDHVWEAMREQDSQGPDPSSGSQGQASPN
jgi:hypothetical protein